MRALIIARRELYAYLRSPLGSAIIAAALLVDGILFYFASLDTKRLSAQLLTQFFYDSSAATMVAGLLLSMRLLAEERQSGTITLLNTAPIRDRDIVVGKFISSFGVLTLMNLLTAYMPLMVYIRGKVSVGHILVGYLGMILLGAAVTAIGLFASSLARSQVVAVIIGAAMVSSMILLWVVARAVSPPFNTFFSGLALHHENYRPFMVGTLSFDRVAYYLMVTYFFLLSATKVLGGPPMALKEAAEKSADSGRAAPGWVFPLYAAGMGLVFLGERVLSGLEKGGSAATALGVLCVIAATALRFSPRFKTGGERKSIESVLAVLSLTGLGALAIYFATTDAGVDKLGLASMAVTKKEHLLGELRVLWIALSAVSLIPMLFAETALWPMRRAERPESRRVRAAASAGLTLALAAIYGALLVYAAGGVPWKADYSYFKTSRPSESTRKVAASLAEPVKVVAFFPDVNEVRNEVASYLRDLATGMPKLQLQISDRLLSPKLAKELRATQDGVIVFSKGSVNYTVNLGTDIETARPKLKTLDKDVKEQLLKLARARLTAYLTVGHGELNDAGKGKEDPARSASIARQLLQKQNLTLKDLGLGQGLASDVPDDADVVLVLGPSEPFAAEEISALQRYADRGGHLFIAFEPDANSAQITTPAAGEASPTSDGEKPAAPPAPAASAAAKKAGATEKPSPAEPPEPAPPWAAALASIAQLTYTPTVLANDHAHVRLSFNNADQVRLISNSFSSHASVSTLSRASAAVVFFGTGSLERASNATAKIDFAVRAPSGSFADRNKNYVQDKDSEKTGSFNLAAAVSRPIASAGTTPAPDKDKDKKPAEKKPESKEMRAFVVADSDAFGDLVMSNVRGNQVLLADAVRWLVGEASFAGAETSEEDVRIETTKQQDLSWFYATIFGAPCLVLAAGVVISRRSRRAGGAKR